MAVLAVKAEYDTIAWGVEWHSRNRADGDRRNLQWTPEKHFRLFRTRRECQAWIETWYGYIRTRPDLKAEPHGWRMPRPVRVGIERLTSR